jgi:tetratricopeptide (TPR) repeat protein
MSVVVVRRLLFWCILVAILVAACPPAWADDEADQIAHARQLIAEKKHSDAVAILVPITSSSVPANARLSKELLVQCYRALGHFSEAIAVIQSLRQEYPEEAAAWLVRLAICYRERGEVPRALAALSDALATTSRPAVITQALAENLYNCYDLSHQWQAGASLAQSMVESEPQNAIVWAFLLGRCQQRAGQDAAAAATFERAFELAKTDADAVKRIAPWLFDAYLENEEPSKAEALIGRLDQDYPVHHAYWQSLLRRYHKSQARALLHNAYGIQSAGAYTEAMAAFSDVIDRFPSFNNLVASAHICVVECMQALGRAEEAAAYASRLYDDQPDMRPAALCAQGELRLFAQDYAGAEALFRRVLNEYPKDQRVRLARSLLACALQKAGRIDEAIELLGWSSDPERKAAQADPEQEAALLYRKAEVYLGAKRFSEVIVILEQLRASPDLPYELRARAEYTLAYCYRQVGNSEAAENGMQAVITNYPNSEAARDAGKALQSWQSAGGG